MKIHNEFQVKVTKYYPYRTARVQDVFITLSHWNCEHDSEFSQAFEEWRESFGKRDNHVCFELEKNGKKMYVMFSDLKAYIGLSIVEKDW